MLSPSAPRACRCFVQHGEDYCCYLHFLFAALLDSGMRFAQDTACAEKHTDQYALRSQHLAGVCFGSVNVIEWGPRRSSRLCEGTQLCMHAGATEQLFVMERGQ